MLGERGPGVGGWGGVGGCAGGQSGAAGEGPPAHASSRHHPSKGIPTPHLQAVAILQKIEVAHVVEVETGRGGVKWGGGEGAGGGGGCGGRGWGVGVGVRRNQADMVAEVTRGR